MDWVNKRVLVTGGSGFIGTALCDKLERLGARVIDYDILHGDDVCDYSRLCVAVGSRSLDLVYHLAAKAIVPIANENPYETLTTNVGGTLNVIEACNHYKVPLILASSDKAYGEAITSYREDTSLKGYFAYDLSKLVGDRFAQLYNDRYTGNVRIVRLCNIYGPGDLHMSRLIPYLIYCGLKGKQPVLRGDRGMLREWLYIDEAVDFYLQVADSHKGLSLHGGVSLTVGQVYDIIDTKLSLGKPAREPMAGGELFRQKFDSMFTKTEVPFSQGIDQTILWWQEKLKWEVGT